MIPFVIDDGSEEGPMTLMKGVVPRVMYLAPLAGVTLSIYDAISARIIAKKKVSNILVDIYSRYLEGRYLRLKTHVCIWFSCGVAPFLFISPHPT
jgi:hypothetical protein